jgi:hypothetical protein
MSSKKPFLIDYTDSLFHFLQQLTIAIFIHNDGIDAITSIELRLLIGPYQIVRMLIAMVDQDINSILNACI